MNLLKSALAGAASAVGTHYADEAMNPTPHDPKVYYGVAAGGLIGAFLLRNKSPIGAGLLFGVGVGSAYQGYTRTGKVAAVYSTMAAPSMLTPQVNPFTTFTTPTDVYPTRPAPLPAPKPAAPPPKPSIGGYNIDDLERMAKNGDELAQKILSGFGVDTEGLGSPFDPSTWGDSSNWGL